MYWAMLTCQWDLWKSNGLIFPFLISFTFFVKRLYVAYMYLKNKQTNKKVGVECLFFYTFNLACGVEVLP